MTEITQTRAVELAEGIRVGRWSALDVVDAHLSRIRRVDPLVAAYVTLLRDRARAAARRRDSEARGGQPLGSLHGVPVGVKDLVAIEGVPMTAGSSFLGREPSRESATIVRRLEAAGAIVLGTTTLTEFALGTTGLNPHGRTSRNPWNLERIAGGSSSGSAAAVAAGLAAAAIGTDTAGSIRIPGGLCGIVAMKPTFGRVSRHGVLPLAGSFDTVGLMARCVADVALMFDVIAGPDPADPHCANVPLAHGTKTTSDLRGVRVARLSGSFFEDELDPAVEGALEEAVGTLKRAGLLVQPVKMQSVEAAHEAQLTVLRAEAAAFHRATFPGHEGDYNPDVRAILEHGASITQSALDDARTVVRRFQAEVATLLSDYPLLLAPAVPIGAPSLADADPKARRWPQIRRQLGRFTRIFSAAGIPAIVLPAALTSEGLPVALQLGAGPFAESLLLAASSILELAIDWSAPELPRSLDGSSRLPTAHRPTA